MKTFICHHQHDSFQRLKRFSDEVSGDNNECDFLIEHDEMCQNKEDLHNLVKQCNLKSCYKVMHGVKDSFNWTKGF